MDKNAKSQHDQKNRFLKLSLKKNREKRENQRRKSNTSLDLIIIDDSFDPLVAEHNAAKNDLPKMCSPIVIEDSLEISYDSNLPKVLTTKPSKAGKLNVSSNSTQSDTSIFEDRGTRPSFGGWSPAQGIMCATPRNQPTPSTPRDIVNESSKQCSIKKIEQSQKKLLSELYGEVWKSIPTLFKTVSKKDCSNISGCMKKLDFLDDSDKENVPKKVFEYTKQLYLTGSDAKRKVRINNDGHSEKKSKKKLYTEKIPNTPEPAKGKSVRIKRDVTTTTKKLKGKSVTELVYLMKDKFDVDSLTKDVENISVNPGLNKIDRNKIKVNDNISRLSFMGSLADNVPSWRMHPEAYEYRDDFKNKKDKLIRRLFDEFNTNVFDNGLESDMIVQWDTKLRSTAGTTTNRAVKKPDGTRLRSSSIKLSVKVVDAPQRLRDTLIHELCHSATWVIDGTLKAGHGPLWKKWAHRAVQVYPELGEISRCHDMEIHYKYTYKCTQCGYTICRHSKSLDIMSKCCGYCRGKFVILLNKKNKDGVVVSTPARQREVSDFALYVKQNYGTLKDGKRTHAQVMKLLGEQFSALKKTS